MRTLSFFLGIAAGLFVALLVAGAVQADAPTRVGPERCGECHEQEFEAWSAAHHSVLLTDAEDDAVLDAMDAMSEKLALDDPESDASCAGCHFNAYVDSDGDEQIGAVDCESCHGLASAWMPIHDDYGERDGKRIKRAEDEDAAHRADRIARARAAGMLRPAQAAAIATNCQGCHGGPDAALVDRGGHPPASDFELVSWLSGEVRHNFHRTAQERNAPLSAERRRQLYLVGSAIALQRALRDLAESTAPGPHRDSALSRIARESARLSAASQTGALPELGDVLDPATTGRLAQPDAAALSGDAARLADALAAAAERLAEAHDGSGLAHLDPLLPTDARGTPYGEAP